MLPRPPTYALRACSRETRRGGVADRTRAGAAAARRGAAWTQDRRWDGTVAARPLGPGGPCRAWRVGAGEDTGLARGWPRTLSTRISSLDLIPPSNVVAFIYTLSQLIRVNTVSPSRLRSHARVKPNDPARCETAVSRSLRLAQEGRHQLTVENRSLPRYRVTALHNKGGTELYYEYM